MLRHVLERQQAGERISDAAMAQYLEQLARAETDRERMQEAVRTFWAMLGKEQAH